MWDKDADPHSHTPSIRWDFLSIYDTDGTLLKRSKGYPTYYDISLEYDGVEFVCSPGYEDATIAVIWESLVKWNKDNE